jgi:hypothetical protein
MWNSAQPGGGNKSEPGSGYCYDNYIDVTEYDVDDDGNYYYAGTWRVDEGVTCY